MMITGFRNMAFFHLLLAPLFSLVLILMMATGFIMYFPGLFALNKIRLLKKEVVAKDTMAFYFSKPLGYHYLAGQHADFTLSAGTHTFSLASAPKENFLMIATRMRPSPFKKVLKNLRVGDQISISAPAGNFVLQTDKKAVFIAGGIGITPFYSMIKQHPNHDITLITSNRMPEDAPFLKSLQAINVFTKKDGHLTWKKIKKIAPAGALFYLAGPPSFVNALKKTGGKNRRIYRLLRSNCNLAFYGRTQMVMENPKYLVAEK